ncbi:hypothetical protein KBF61_04235 [Candidatus Saccharibacteria bacterium]|nr:hypothetical protein [Candidatus Saccharibacteria bacterium]MBP9132314.1 hypothetical protein [Candidatus Saccharibacteria bacterium]
MSRSSPEVPDQPDGPDTQPVWPDLSDPNVGWTHSEAGPHDVPTEEDLVNEPVPEQGSRGGMWGEAAVMLEEMGPGATDRAAGVLGLGFGALVGFAVNEKLASKEVTVGQETLVSVDSFDRTVDITTPEALGVVVFAVTSLAARYAIRKSARAARKRNESK